MARLGRRPAVGAFERRRRAAPVAAAAGSPAASSAATRRRRAPTAANAGVSRRPRSPPRDATPRPWPRPCRAACCGRVPLPAGAESISASSGSSGMPSTGRRLRPPHSRRRRGRPFRLQAIGEAHAHVVVERLARALAQRIDRRRPSAVYADARVGPAAEQIAFVPRRRAERPRGVGQPAFHVRAHRLVVFDGHADVVDDPFAIQLADRRHARRGRADRSRRSPAGTSARRRTDAGCGSPRRECRRAARRAAGSRPRRWCRARARPRAGAATRPRVAAPPSGGRASPSRSCPCAGCSSTRRPGCPTTSRTGGRRRRGPTAGRPRRRRRGPDGSRARRARPRRPSPARRPTSGWRRSRAADRRAARPRRC